MDVEHTKALACDGCGFAVDEDGDTIEFKCSYGPHACEDCGACYCDGSC